ncbi:MAG: phospholipase D-like domain-containing protein [Cyclobacteriaceae bacterium]|nr:phospholipase D-like domain-containing protein [Cyclobacteriaceae bacterium]
MDQIINFLSESITDEVLSKSEKRSLKDLLRTCAPDRHQLAVLRSKIYEIAQEHVTAANYRFILEWVKTATSALQDSQLETTESTTVFFSPGDACRNTIIRQIDLSVKQLQICVFTISDDTITNAILTAHKRGIDIRIITDNDKSEDEGSDIARLSRHGIAVKMDTTPNHMHHKFMICDAQTLLTGSYNWTRSAAQYNHENILLTSHTAAVKSYLKEFDQLWKTMTLYK